ncbi:MAG: hypothetical protein RLY30_1468 [Pseudomonadota bacterium]
MHPDGEDASGSEVFRHAEVEGGKAQGSAELLAIAHSSAEEVGRLKQGTHLVHLTSL